MLNKKRSFSPGPKNEHARTRPSLVRWAQLSEMEREQNRDAIRDIPRLLALAKFRVRSIPSTLKLPTQCSDEVNQP